MPSKRTQDKTNWEADKKLDNGLICTQYDSTNSQFPDVITKGLRPSKDLSELRMKNAYSPAWGQMSKN